MGFNTVSEKQQKIMLFSKFGLSPDTVINHYAISQIQQAMSLSQLQGYLQEIRNLMLSKIDEYPQVTKLNIDEATSFLMLAASPIDKYHAMCRSLDLWEF